MAPVHGCCIGRTGSWSASKLRGFLLVALSLGFLGAPSRAGAQVGPQSKYLDLGSDTAESTGWKLLAGQNVSRPHVKLGLWALHPFEPQFPELDWVSGFGIKADQWLVATFINSYDRRAFVVALERYWWAEQLDWIDLGVGYRAGVITGYTEELIEWAGSAPALPFAGLLLWVDVGPLSIDGFYAYRGITLEAGLRFR
tara:strand:- start:84 stop:677 length:594 start_codon:yes stop_codon:yes gene_type:complete